jgi:hypothetical protein
MYGSTKRQLTTTRNFCSRFSLSWFRCMSCIVVKNLTCKGLFHVVLCTLDKELYTSPISIEAILAWKPIDTVPLIPFVIHKGPMTHEKAKL